MFVWLTPVDLAAQCYVVGVLEGVLLKACEMTKPNENNSSLKSIILTVTFFAVYMVLKEYFPQIKGRLDDFTHNGLSSYVLTYLIIGVPIYVGTYLISPTVSIFKSLGLEHNPVKALLGALLFSLPMFLGGLLFFEFNQNLSVPNVIAGTIVAGFVEELFFRGFLFGQLFKNTQLGFLSSIIIGAIIFAAGHLYQSQDTVELVGVFLVTFMGAILFAWLYVEWNYNLWVPIFLHSLMNLAWYLFDMDETALGGLLPNLLRGLTIAVAIAITVYCKKRQDKKLVVTKENLVMKAV